MSGQLQPQELKKLAISSFGSRLEVKARELIKIFKEAMENDVPFGESLSTFSRICTDLKHFFHGTRLPSALANELTLSLLITFKEILGDVQCENSVIVMDLVEILIHPDVTEIELISRSLCGVHLCDVHYRKIVKAVLVKIGNLHNLKRINLEFDYYGDTDREADNVIILPSKLTEFTLSCSIFLSDNYIVVVDACTELKSLKLKACTISPQSILKCKHLETLHLVCTTFKGEDLRYFINEIDTLPTLRSLGITLEDEETLCRIVDKLPNLTELILDLHMDSDGNFSSLTKLTNLRSLSVSSPFFFCEGYRAILPALGKKLVSLCLSDLSLDLEFIGETFTNLKSLHLHGLCSGESTQPCLKSFPNFRSVEFLEVYMSSHPYWIEFIVSKCTNVKELRVAFYKSLHSVVTMLADRTSLEDSRRIHWWTSESKTDRSVVEELRSKYPGVLIVHEQDHQFYSEIVVLHGSRHNFCSILPYTFSGIFPPYTFFKD